MRFELPCGPGEDELLAFLQRNGLAGATIKPGRTRITIDIPDGRLSDPALRAALTRHFAYMDMFVWAAGGFEDVAFWARPERWPDVAAEVRRFYPPGCYDVLGTLEARGFFISGVLSHALGKPVVPVRKHRAAYARFPGRTVAYRNWRGESERLWLQSMPWMQALRGGRVLFLDDVLETGNSLEACRGLLTDAGMSVVGAMYLIDVSEPGVRERFGFPVRSLLRMQGLGGNTAPAVHAAGETGGHARI